MFLMGKLLIGLVRESQTPFGVLNILWEALVRILFCFGMLEIWTLFHLFRLDLVFEYRVLCGWLIN